MNEINQTGNPRNTTYISSLKIGELFLNGSRLGIRADAATTWGVYLDTGKLVNGDIAITPVADGTMFTLMAMRRNNTSA